MTTSLSRLRLMMAAWAIGLIVTLPACTKKDGSDTKDKDGAAADDGTGVDAGTDATDAVDGTDTADGVDAGTDDTTTDGTDTDGADTDGTDGEETNVVIITGTVALAATDINGGDVIDGLTLGLPVEAATVFVAGFPDQTATTDDLGNFTLALETGVSADLLAASYEVVTWKVTTATPPVKFGKLTTGTPTGDKLDIGNVELKYTRQARITVKDSATDLDITDDGPAYCGVVFLDYGDKVEAALSGSLIIADYLPQGEYRIKTSCTGYAPKTETIEMPAPDANPTAWTPIVVEVDPL